MSEKFASREVMNLIFCDYKTGKPILNLDYANTTTTEMESDNLFAYGGWNHPKRVAFNGEKNATMTVETQIRTFELYSLITGAEIQTTAKFIKREELTAAAGVLTMSKTPVAGTVNVFAIDDDCGTAETVTVDATAKTATLTNTSDTGKHIVYYMTELSDVQALSVKSTVFPKDVAIYGETLVKTEAGDLVPYKMVVYKATPQTDLNLEHTNDGDPTTLTITFDIMADGDNNMIDLIMEEPEE